MRNERHRALLEAIRELPAAAGELLWLHYFEGLKYREIAEIVDGHPTTVKVQVHRARRELRRKLDARWKDDGGNGTASNDRAEDDSTPRAATAGESAREQEAGT